MPVQTTKTGYIEFPDGARVSVKESGGSTWTDIGALNSPVNFTLNWTENQVVTANAGRTALQVRDMLIDGSFTMINLEPDAINKLSGGLFTLTETAASPVSDIADQVIAAGWGENTLYDLVLDSTAEGEIRTTAQPTLTSVELDAAGTPEALVEDEDYFVVANPNSKSGWSVQFVTANIVKASPTTFAITIDYDTNTPIASTTITGGESTKELDAYALKAEHYNSAGDVDRSFEIYSANPQSGGFQFNFKGANEDGLEEMPITFRGDIDTTRAAGAQLFTYYVKEA
jgi:hypothetical protein